MSAVPFSQVLHFVCLQNLTFSSHRLARSRPSREAPHLFQRLGLIWHEVPGKLFLAPAN